MSRQGVFQLAFTGLIILGVLGFYFWKKAALVPSPTASRAPSTNPSSSPAPGEPENPWAAGVGEVPSFGGSSGLGHPSYSEKPFAGGGSSSLASSDSETLRTQPTAQAEVPESRAEASVSPPPEEPRNGKKAEPPRLLTLLSEAADSLRELSLTKHRLPRGPEDRQDPDSRRVFPERSSARSSSSDPTVEGRPEQLSDPTPPIAAHTHSLPEAPVVPETAPEEDQEDIDTLPGSQPSGNGGKIASIDLRESSVPSQQAEASKEEEAKTSIRFTVAELRMLPPDNAEQEPALLPTDPSTPPQPSQAPTSDSPRDSLPSAPNPGADSSYPPMAHSHEPVSPRIASVLDGLSPAPEPKTEKPSVLHREASTLFESSEELEEEGLAPGRKSVCPRQAAAQAHKTLFYDNRFDYLDHSCCQETFLGDRLKRWAIGPWATLDVGGEYRLRHQSERNHRGTGLTGRDDDLLLHRTRLYANLELGELARFYAEMNDALSTNETYPPRSSEENRTELQNLFAEVSLLGWRSEGLVGRFGRQELLYGNERLVSPLDWANTRRTFEGYKLFWQGPLWTLDLFWVQPIYPNPDAFDSPDQSQQFMGLYCTRRLGTQAGIEAYYLRLVDTDSPTVNFDFHTFGLRSHQDYRGWLGELEAAVQCGSYGPEEHLAGMYTIGMGRRFDKLPWRPIFWIYYDWASGDQTLGNGFHHLMPDSHQYLGWMDLFGRRNIEDWNFRLLLHPHENWTLTLAWHIFHRQNPWDVPYDVNMNPLVLTPGGSGDLGQEFDLLLSWRMTPRAELSFGYSHFFAGEFFRTNPTPPPYGNDADFFYTQFTLRF